MTYQQPFNSVEKELISRADFCIKPYLQRSNARAFWQIISTILPIAVLWLVVAEIGHSPLYFLQKALALFPLLGLLALFSSRAFSLMHDCGHGSLFRSFWLNRTIGFLLGVVNAIPQHPWSRDHAFHHRHNGNWEIYRGPIDVLSLEEYQALTKPRKLLYVISRHWLMLFPGGFYYLIIKPRVTLILTLTDFIWSIAKAILNRLLTMNFSKISSLSIRLRSHNSGYGNTFGEQFDLVANNIAVIICWLLMSQWLGTGLFWSCYSVVMTASAAIFICLFFVQHNFKDSYASCTEDWDLLLGALEGSSNLRLPRWMDWFFADISFHSLHHVCDRIPNYHLRACHLENQHLLKNAMTLSLVDIPSCFGYILWNSKSQKLTTIREAQKISQLSNSL